MDKLSGFEVLVLGTEKELTGRVIRSPKAQCSQNS